MSKCNFMLNMLIYDSNGPYYVNQAQTPHKNIKKSLSCGLLVETSIVGTTFYCICKNVAEISQHLSFHVI